MLETVWYELASRSGGWLSVLALAVLKAGVILGLAGLVAFALRGASAAVRHQVWLVGVVCALAVPLLGAVLPEFRVPGPAWLAGSRGAGEAWAEVAPVVDIPAIPSVAWSGAVAEIEARAAEAAARAEAAAAEATVRMEELAARLGEVGARATTMAAQAEAAVAAAAAAEQVRIAIPRAIAAPRPGSAAPAISVLPVPRTPPPAPPAPTFPPGGGVFLEPVEWSGADVGGFPWAVPLLGLWLFGVWVVASGIVGGALRVAWIGWQSRPVTTGRVATLSAAIAEELGLRDVRVLLGPSTAMPMTWGLLRPTVLLPEGAESWPVDQLDAALRHELAHARRRDTLTQLIADIGCALYWFNPLAWLAAHRLRVEREHACDDEVLASGSKPSDYATQLLDMTRALRAARLTAMAAIPMARPSQLRDRLEAVLDEDRVRGRLSRPARARGWAAGFLLALPVAMLGFTPMASFANDHDYAFDFDFDYDVDFAHEVEHADEAPHAWAAPAHGGWAVAVAPAEWQECARGRRRAGYSFSVDDDEQRIEWYEDGCRRRVEIEGEVAFDDAFRRIRSISPGGQVRIEVETASGERAVEMEHADGGIAYAYFEDGDERPFDDDARAWLDDVVLELLRTGYMAEERAAALLRTGGATAVIDEVEQLRSDLARRIYYGAALAHETVPPALAVDLIRHAADAIGSDFELAQLLIGTADDRPLDGAIADAFLDASYSVSSDFERRRLLSEVLARASLTAGQQAHLIASAADLGSDFEKTEVLVGVADGGIADADVQRAYIDAAATIGSDHDRRRALDAILSESRLDGDIVAQAISAAADLRSDFDKAETLLHLARTQDLDDASRAAFVEAVSTIRSDHDHDRVSAAAVRSNR
jgi:beta-lactamase regulating signal transducer with metallopeptidase domain